MSYFKTYSELITLPSFEERLKYLQMVSRVGEDTFGYKRYLNQALYRNSREWQIVRDKAMIRDDGCDLGMPGKYIVGRIYVHHIMPLTELDFLQNTDRLFDLDNLICCSFETHQAIHYGSEIAKMEFVERQPNDTCLWKK